MVQPFPVLAATLWADCFYNWATLVVYANDLHNSGQRPRKIIPLMFAVAAFVVCFVDSMLPYIYHRLINGSRPVANLAYRFTRASRHLRSGPLGMEWPVIFPSLHSGASRHLTLRLPLSAFSSDSPRLCSIEILSVRLLQAGPRNHPCCLV